MNPWSMVHDNSPITHEKNQPFKRNPPWAASRTHTGQCTHHEIQHSRRWNPDMKTSPKELICNPVLESEELIVCFVWFGLFGLFVWFVRSFVHFFLYFVFDVQALFFWIKKRRPQKQHAGHFPPGFQLNWKTSGLLGSMASLSHCWHHVAIGHLSRTPGCRPPLRGGTSWGWRRSGNIKVRQLVRWFKTYSIISTIINIVIIVLLLLLPLYISVIIIA